MVIHLFIVAVICTVIQHIILDLSMEELHAIISGSQVLLSSLNPKSCLSTTLFIEAPCNGENKIIALCG